MAAASRQSTLCMEDITECPICAETLTDAKVLPCIHTFCLKCLQTYGKDKKPGDEVSCPLCRTNFLVPQKGFDGLPNNYFINQLLLINQLSIKKGSPQVQHCNPCLEANGEIEAVSYCLNCNEHFCDSCSKSHKNYKISKSHQVVSIRDKPSSEELVKLAVSYCGQHPNEEIKLYCYDCKEVTCVLCHVTNHTNHKCCEINQSAEEFRAQLSDDMTKVSSCVQQSQDKMERVERDRQKFLDQVSAAEREISKTCDQLRSLIDAQQKKLMEELDCIKRKRVKEMESRRDEDERHLVMLESFKKYCEEMKEKGTACDISRAAGDLHVRAVQLIKSQQTHNSLQLDQVDVSFIAAQATQDDVKKLTGQIEFDGQFVVIFYFYNNISFCVTKVGKGKTCL